MDDVAAAPSGAQAALDMVTAIRGDVSRARVVRGLA